MLNQLVSVTDPLAHGIQYAHDSANRLTNMGGVAQTWDANGNLLNEGGCILIPIVKVGVMNFS